MSKRIVLAKVLAIGTTESGRAWTYGKKLPDEELSDSLWNDLAPPAVSAAAALGALLEHQTEANQGEPRFPIPLMHRLSPPMHGQRDLCEGGSSLELA